LNGDSDSLFDGHFIIKVPVMMKTIYLHSEGPPESVAPTTIP